MQRSYSTPALAPRIGRYEIRGACAPGIGRFTTVAGIAAEGALLLGQDSGYEMVILERPRKLSVSGADEGEREDGGRDKTMRHACDVTALPQLNQQEHLIKAAVSNNGWLALLYLTVAGSIVAFTACTWLIHHESPTKVETYAHV